MNPREIIAICIIIFLSVFYIIHCERILQQEKEIQELKAKQYKIFLQIK